jgi:hypothetical protein
MSSAAKIVMTAPCEKFSSEHYAFSPLFHEPEKYCEAAILHSGDESTWAVKLK